MTGCENALDFLSTIYNMHWQIINETEQFNYLKLAIGKIMNNVLQKVQVNLEGEVPKRPGNVFYSWTALGSP